MDILKNLHTVQFFNNTSYGPDINRWSSMAEIIQKHPLGPTFLMYYPLQYTSKNSVDAPQLACWKKESDYATYYQFGFATWPWRDWKDDKFKNTSQSREFDENQVLTSKNILFTFLI